MRKVLYIYLRHKHSFRLRGSWHDNRAVCSPDTAHHDSQSAAKIEPELKVKISLSPTCEFNLHWWRAGTIAFDMFFKIVFFLFHRETLSEHHNPGTSCCLVGKRQSRHMSPRNCSTLYFNALHSKEPYGMFARVVEAVIGNMCCILGTMLIVGCLTAKI